MRHLLPFKYVDSIAKAGSIRKAADLLAITPSALNRRLLSIEEELGVSIFERLPSGVRLNTAGEILLEHIRNQISDLERVKSQIADLSGVRRGHVSISATPELLGGFLSSQIRDYQNEFPGVSFSVQQHFRGNVELALSNHSADIGLVFEPLKLAEFQSVLSLRQTLHCVVPHDHPLSKKETLRLYECAEFPQMLQDTSWGIRHLLEQSSIRLGLNLKSAIQTDSRELLGKFAADTECLTYDIPLNLKSKRKMGNARAIPLNTLDVPEGFVFLGHLKGRTLPVAAARFLEQVTTSLAAEIEE